MVRPGRNDACPCGSGKKYKKCCLEADEAAGRAIRQAAQRVAPALDAWASDEDDDGIVERSNAIVDLIHDGRLDEAERAARELMRTSPGFSDGLERLGHVYEARGDGRDAANLHRRAAVLARSRSSENADHANWLLDLANRLDPIKAES